MSLRSVRPSRPLATRSIASRTHTRTPTCRPPARPSRSPTGDARAHTFDVKVMADDPEGQLKPGMFAQVAIVTAQRNDALLVPNAAVIQQGPSARVFVVANGKAAARPVKVGVSDATNT